VLEVGRPGQFDILVDGEIVATRSSSILARLFGGGWPDPRRVVDAIRARTAAGAPR
jgi:hypothetical protein